MPDAQYWRDRAEEVRARAEAMHDLWRGKPCSRSPRNTRSWQSERRGVGKRNSGSFAGSMPLSPSSDWGQVAIGITYYSLSLVRVAYQRSDQDEPLSRSCRRGGEVVPRSHSRMTDQ